MDEQDRPGLGAHLYEALAQRIPVVGIAKTKFLSAKKALPVLHGCSQNPLFVTAIGVAVDSVLNSIVSMHGPYRIPTLLQRVDHLSRGLSLPMDPSDRTILVQRSVVSDPS